MINFIPRNVGRLDQLIRFAISSSMIYAGFINNGLIKDPFSSNLLGAIGIVLLFTVVLRCCPLYCLVEWNTCSENRQKAVRKNVQDGD